MLLADLPDAICRVTSCLVNFKRERRILDEQISLLCTMYEARFSFSPLLFPGLLAKKKRSMAIPATNSDAIGAFHWPVSGGMR